MDIDAFHDGQGVVLEVEAGRAWNGNAIYASQRLKLPFEGVLLIGY